MPETQWLLYAENVPAPLCRKPSGSYMAEDDICCVPASSSVPSALSFCSAPPIRLSVCTFRSMFAALMNPARLHHRPRGVDVAALDAAPDLPNVDLIRLVRQRGRVHRQRVGRTDAARIQNAA